MLDELWNDGTAARRLSAVTVLAATVVAAQATPSGESRAAYVALLTVAAGAGLAWTVRTPGEPATLVCLLVLGGAGGLLVAAGDDRDSIAAALIFALVAAGAAAQRYERARALAVAGVASVALLAGAPREPAIVAFAALVLPVTLATAIARRGYVKRAELAEQLLAEAQRSREERARAAALAERLRVAREVHDVLAHSLTALSISLETAEALLDERQDLAAGLQQVRRAHGLAVAGLVETRGAVAALRGTPVALPEALERLLADYRADTAAPATLVMTGEPRALAAEPALALSRIAQEALTNVRRHAHGAAVEAALDYRPGAVRLEIRNRLTAAPRSDAAGRGYGLRGMRERADACGGRLRAGAAEGAWRVEAELPS
jgi:signal transduction histidine kinase